MLYKFIIADELFEKVLRNLETCPYVNINLSEKLVSSLESSMTFDEIFKFTSAPSLIPDLNKLWIRQFYI